MPSIRKSPAEARRRREFLKVELRKTGSGLILKIDLGSGFSYICPLSDNR
jgi:hypothetical protein